MKELKLPIYNCENSQVIDCGNSCSMIYAAPTTLEEFEAYCEKIALAGFEMKSRRAAKDNVFYTFVDSDSFVYAYYFDHYKSARIVFGDRSLLADEDCGSFEEKYTPSLTMVGQTTYMNCAQGYIFLLPDGRFLVHDGGCRYSDKKDFMYESIKALAPDPDNIIIAAWFISHPHGDHQDAFEEFIELHGSEVELQRVVYNYAAPEAYTYKRKDGQSEDCMPLAVRLPEKVAAYTPNAQLIKAHNGQIMRFGSVTVEVLFSVEDYLPIECFDYVNTTSLVIRIECCSQSILLLADTTHSSGRIIENIYGDYLKADMVQLAHHGMWASYLSLYQCAKADVVLWPNTKAGIKNGNSPWYDDKVVLGTLEMAEDLYVSDVENTTLIIPHALTHNKESVLEYLKG